MTLSVANSSTPPIFWAMAEQARNESARAAAVNSENYLDMVCLLISWASLSSSGRRPSVTGQASPVVSLNLCKIARELLPSVEVQI